MYITSLFWKQNKPRRSCFSVNRISHTTEKEERKQITGYFAWVKRGLFTPWKFILMYKYASVGFERVSNFEEKGKHFVYEFIINLHDMNKDELVWRSCYECIALCRFSSCYVVVNCPAISLSHSSGRHDRGIAGEFLCVWGENLISYFTSPPLHFRR